MPSINELNYGYDLDGGGYSFEEAPAVFNDNMGGGIVALDDPDLDYLGLQDNGLDIYAHGCVLFVLAPGDFEAKWPDSYEDDDGDTHVQFGRGTLHSHDHTCCCQGKMVEWCGAAGEPTEPLSKEKVAEYLAAGVECDDVGVPVFFEHQGSFDLAAFPDCERCEGNGYLTTHGGSWAIYGMKYGD